MAAAGVRLRVLGASAGIGAGQRTSSLLVDDDALIDAGTGVGDLSLTQMAAVGHVFLTHSHLDHVGFLPLLADAATAAREGPLLVYGLEETLETLKDCLFNGRLWPDYGVLPSPEHPYVRFQTITPGCAVALGRCAVTPLPACHSVPAVGYYLDSGTGGLALSGDTTLCEDFWQALRRLPKLRQLIMECTFSDEQGDQAQRYGHMTPGLLAQGLARLEHPIQLYVVHMDSAQRERILREVKAAAGGFHPVPLETGMVLRV